MKYRIRYNHNNHIVKMENNALIYGALEPAGDTLDEAMELACRRIYGKKADMLYIEMRDSDTKKWFAVRTMDNRYRVNSVRIATR